MIKIAGALLIILAGGMVGLIMARDYLRRPKELKAFLASLQMLETEIMYAATPLGEALERVGEASDTAVKRFFQETAVLLQSAVGYTAAEAWYKALDKYYAISALRERDVLILKNLGNALGISDRQDQSKHLRLAAEQLKMECSRAEEEAKRNVKLCNYMGFCGGLALVLLIY